MLGCWYRECTFVIHSSTAEVPPESFDGSGAHRTKRPEVEVRPTCGHTARRDKTLFLVAYFWHARGAAYAASFCKRVG